MRVRTLITTSATVAGLVMATTAAAGAATASPQVRAVAAHAVQADYTFDYETGTEGWVAKKDSKLPSGSVDWSTEQAQSGSHSLKFTLDGNQDDGTLWVQRRFAVPAGRTRVDVELSFWEWNDGDNQATNWPIVAYAGRNAPTQEEHFTEVGRTEHDGWTQYTYRTTVDVTGLTSFYAAYGLSVTWETQRSAHFDLAQVSVN